MGEHGVHRPTAVAPSRIHDAGLNFSGVPACTSAVANTAPHDSTTAEWNGVLRSRPSAIHEGNVEWRRAATRRETSKAVA